MQYAYRFKLYERIGCNGTVTWEDVKAYRDANDLTWHEEIDGKHMDLVSEYVNHTYGHLGGVGEQKRKEVKTFIQRLAPDSFPVTFYFTGFFILPCRSLWPGHRCGMPG